MGLLNILLQCNVLTVIAKVEYFFNYYGQWLSGWLVITLLAVVN